MPKPSLDITGQTFHKLTALKLLRTESVEWSDKRDRTFAVWLWRCECGNEIEAQARYVKRGFKKSCGCHVRRGQLVPAWNAYKKCYADGNLPFEKFCELAQLNCYYCGAPPSNKKNYHGHMYIYNGLDRLDSSLPHDINNCVTSCWTCNEMKKAKPFAEFLAHIQRIHSYCDALQK